MSTFEHYSLENPSFIDAMDGFCYFSEYSNIYGAVIVVLNWRGYRGDFLRKESFSLFSLSSYFFNLKLHRFVLQ